MFSFLSVLSGALIAVMIVFNGDLSSVYGNYQATVVIHATGLVCILLWMLFRREKFSLSRGMPFLYYLGGVFGVCTTVFNNLTFAALGVSATLAIGLLGQVGTSALIDQFGWFGVKRRPFRPKHLISFGLILAGIVVMLWQ